MPRNSNRGWKTRRKTGSFPPASLGFKKAVVRWYRSFERRSSEQYRDELQQRAKCFLLRGGFECLWEIEQREGIPTDAGRKIFFQGQVHVIPYRLNNKTEEVLDLLAEMNVAFLELPDEIKQPEKVKQIRKLLAKETRAQVVARFNKTADELEILGPMIHEDGLPGSVVATYLRKVANHVSNLRNPEGRKPEVFLRLVGMELMEILDDKRHYPPWTLAGKLMHAGFYSSVRDRKERLDKWLKELIRDGVLNLRKRKITRSKHGQLVVTYYVDGRQYRLEGN